MVVDNVPFAVGDFVLLSEEVAVNIEVCGQHDVHAFFVLGMQYTLTSRNEHSSKWFCTGVQHAYQVFEFKHVHCWSDQGGGVILAVR